MYTRGRGAREGARMGQDCPSRDRHGLILQFWACSIWAWSGYEVLLQGPRRGSGNGTPTRISRVIHMACSIDTCDY